MQLKTIAHIRTDFPEKFGIPRQSGLIPELLGKIIFVPNTEIPMQSAVFQNFLTYGFYGAFPKTKGTAFP